MPEFDPKPDPGGSKASGLGPAIVSPEGEPVEGLDPPTVRSAPVGSASGLGSASERRVSIQRPEVLPLPVPGDMVDVFELQESIGAGGMGAVFRAIDTKLDRLVALKILPPDQAVDPEVVLRYHQEGRAAARLDHENIARVYTIGDDGKYHYIAFEYIEGTTIRQRVERDGPLPVGDAINFTLQIGNALVHASERGVVHRDIKPSNIIVTPQGRAKLVDMGLARRFERGQDNGLTQSGMTLGTFDYISPEQARDPRDVDVRGDLYSLGCTLFHMLSGRPPFPEGTVLQKLISHQEEAPPDIRDLNPAVTDDLAAILVKLMAKDRDRRYQTPELLVRDLLTVAGSLGLRSLNPEGLVWMAPAPTPGWVRHVVWGVPGLAFLMLLGFLAWWGDGPIAPSTIGDPGPTPLPIRTIPKVQRTTAPAAVQPLPTPEVDPPREFAVDSRDDLLRVMAEAPPRSTILLADKGPYDLRGSKSRKMSGLDLTIRAETGVRPVLRLPRDLSPLGGSGPLAILDLAGGRLTLEGLDFLVEAGDSSSAIRLEDADVTIRRCSFRRSGTMTSGTRPAAILVRSTAQDPSVSSTDRAAVSLAVDSSDFDGGQAGVIVSGPADLAFRDCTFGPAPADLATFGSDNPQSGMIPLDLSLAHVSVLAGAGPVFRFVGTAPRVRVSDSVFSAPTIASPPATLVAIEGADRLDWRGLDNLYGRIGAYLRPAGLRAPTRTFEAWADDPSVIREAGSVAAEAPPWEDHDPLDTLALASTSIQGSSTPSRAFRLTLARSSPPRVGARNGPVGPLLAPIIGAAAPVSVLASNPIPDDLEPVERREGTNPTRSRESATEAPPLVVSTRPGSKDQAEEMMEMPLELPTRIGGFSLDDEPEDVPTGGLVPMPMPVDPERPIAAPPTSPAVSAPSKPEEPAPVVSNAESGVIRTVRQFLDALARPATGLGPKTLVVAADADWTLPACRPLGSSGWVIRADRGTNRPRFRFRPEPVADSASGPWPALLTVPSGGLRLEGIDIVLPLADAPKSPTRGWSVFGMKPGSADLSLTDCTVTIEGEILRSAVVTVLAGEPNSEAQGLAFDPALPARIRLKDSLFRVGDDLIDVGPGRSIDLDIDNAAIATGGTLVHGHGLPRGRTAGPIKVVLRQVHARLAGGLARLQSTPGQPELPVADFSARDTILATNDPDDPLFRVDGQGDLEQLRDRIHWEGRSVAYHQINVYRRDQTTLPGALPTRFNRDDWGVAVGRREESPFHGDLKFLDEWDPERAAWTLRPEDLRLQPESPAAGAGPDLLHVPSPPRTS
ncbi:protein kinase domain-containing protein [Tundrisphaera lichenicola]|uniref:serine/threonine-protein kinase n=1 Tax=Tundrisphaera lichenicola TaxID=2029860 RepID=UPI003EC0248B